MVYLKDIMYCDLLHTMWEQKENNLPPVCNIGKDYLKSVTKSIESFYALYW